MSDFVTLKIIPTDEETLARYERRCEYNRMVQDFARYHKEVGEIQVTYLDYMELERSGTLE